METTASSDEIPSKETGDSPSYATPSKSHAYPDGPRSALGLYKAMRFGLLAYLATEVLWQILLAAYLVFPEYLPAFMFQQSDDDLNILDSAGVVYLLACVVAFFFACRFTYRAMRNLHTIGSPVARISPTWSVGAYFVPIANFFVPANAMSQIYHGTHEANGEKSRHASPIPIWWSCWLLASVVETIADRSGLLGAGGFAIYAAAGLLNAIAAISLLRMGRTIAEKQELLKHGGVAHVFD